MIYAELQISIFTSVLITLVPVPATAILLVDEKLDITFWAGKSFENAIVLKTLKPH